MRPGWRNCDADSQFQNCTPPCPIRCALAWPGLQLLADTLSGREQELRRLFDLVGTVRAGRAGAKMSESRYSMAFYRADPLRTHRLRVSFQRDGTHLTAYCGAFRTWSPLQIGARDILNLWAGTQYRGGSAGRSSQRILNDLESYLVAKPQSDSTRSSCWKVGDRALPVRWSSIIARSAFCFSPARTKIRIKSSHHAIFRVIANQVSAVIDNSRAYLHIIERNRQLIEEGRRLSEVASRDALTGALNHGGIVRAAERAWMEAAETHKPVGFIMIDIDYFKQINDSFGHGGGDTALKEFTRRLAGVIRQTDQLGRYGGEEFLVILGGAATSESLMRTAERLRQAIVTAPFKLGGEARSVSASFGAALSNGVYKSAQDLLAAADRALYAAKNGGRNRIVIAQ